MCGHILLVSVPVKVSSTPLLLGGGEEGKKLRKDSVIFINTIRIQCTIFPNLMGHLSCKIKLKRKQIC